MFVHKTDLACSDTSLEILKRDTLLEDDNDGVLWLADFSSRYSYPTLAAPTNGIAVSNMDESTDDGTFVVQSGDAPTYAGGGIDLTGITKVGNYLNGPASAAASIWGSTNQYFLACVYVKLPTLANWNGGASLHEILKFAAAGAATYASGAELVTIAQSSVSSALTFRRQTGAGAATIIGSIVPAAGDYGSFAQLAIWRDASGQYGRLKTANGTQLVSAAVGSNNSVNFSALTPKVGSAGGFEGIAVGGTMDADHQDASKYRIFRAFIENLETSERDAATVLNDDYTRTVARGVFS